MNVSADADYLEARADALDDLRHARKKNRIQNIDWFEAFYKAYLAVIIGGVSLYAAAGATGDGAVQGDSLETVRTDGALYLGVLVAVLVGIGLRSAGRGGPLAFELADIRHVLLAPVDRQDSLRSAGVRALRHAVFLGASFGAAAGVLAMRRFPDPAEWLLSGVLFGSAVALLVYGASLIAGGLRLRSVFCDALALLFVAWSLLDVVLGISSSPFSWISHIALWPLDLSAFAYAGLVVSLLVAFIGTRAIEGMSIEAAERRSKLVGQLRFAATMQDVRTVMLLQRQLSQQHLRQRPYIRMRPKYAQRAGVAVYTRRSVQSLLRWPLVRVLRLLGLVAVASVSIAGVWAGTSPLIIVAGLAMWIAAIDLLEPLAQETDHPDRMTSAPVEIGIAHVRLVIVPMLVLFVLTLIAFAPLMYLGPKEPVAILAPLVIPLVASAIGGAAAVVVRQPSMGSPDLSAEIAGVKTFFQLVVPPALPIITLLALPAARESWMSMHDATHLAEAINFVVAAGLVVATWSILWIRYADSMRRTFFEAGARAATNPEPVK